MNNAEKPAWFPDSTIYSSMGYGKCFNINHDLLIIPYNKPWNGRIFFDEIKAYGGFWELLDSYVTTNESFTSEININTPSSTLNDSLPAALETASINPDIKISMPIDKTHYHQIIQVDALITIGYPIVMDNYFEIATQTLTKPLNFLSYLPKR